MFRRTPASNLRGGFLEPCSAFHTCPTAYVPTSRSRRRQAGDVRRLWCSSARRVLEAAQQAGQHLCSMRGVSRLVGLRVMLVDSSTRRGTRTRICGVGVPARTRGGGRHEAWHGRRRAGGGLGGRCGEVHRKSGFQLFDYTLREEQHPLVGENLRAPSSRFRHYNTAWRRR